MCVWHREKREGETYETERGRKSALLRDREAKLRAQVQMQLMCMCVCVCACVCVCVRACVWCWRVSGATGGRRAQPSHSAVRVQQPSILSSSLPRCMSPSLSGSPSSFTSVISCIVCVSITSITTERDSERTSQRLSWNYSDSFLLLLLLFPCVRECRQHTARYP